MTARRLLPILLFLAALALAGCGTKTVRPGVDQATVDSEAELQREMTVEGIAAKLERMNRVSSALLSQDVHLCRAMNKTIPSLGAYFYHYNIKQDPSSWAAAYQKVMGIHPDHMTVTYVVKGGPADQAGLRKGDAVVAVNGKPLSISGRSIYKAWATIDEATEKGPVEFQILRSGQPLSLTIAPGEVCASVYMLAPSDSINAFAAGEAVYVTFGMMRFAGTDDELALILGHEMAHNIMGHVDKMMAQRGFGAALDLLIALATGVNTGLATNAAGLVYSKEYEAEADYVGMYLAARAGYDVDGAAKLWRRMAAESPGAMSGGSTHPGSAERFTALEATAREIDRKKAAGQELVPEMKGGQ